MKYFKDKNNVIYAYAKDGSDDAYIKPNLSQITDLEYNVIINPPKTIDELRTLKQYEIRKSFEENSNANVLALGFYWNGGFDSAIKLDAAMRLSQAANQSSVVFFDVDNNRHTLNFSDALTIVITVAGTYQYTLAKKQELMVAVSTSTLETIGNISW